MSLIQSGFEHKHKILTPTSNPINHALKLVYPYLNKVEKERQNTIKVHYKAHSDKLQ